MRDSLVASNPCQCPTLHPSLANARQRSHFHSTHLFEFIGRNGEGRPSPLRLWVLFDATRGETLSVASVWLYLTRRGGETLPVMSVWCSSMWQGTEHQKCAHLGVLLVFVPSPSNQTCKTCPSGHVLHVWCCLQHRAPETRPFGCFLVLGSFPIPSPLPRSTREIEGSFLIN